MKCPRCETPIKGKALGNGMVWSCGSCGGTSIGAALLQGHAKADFLPALWNEFRTAGLASEAHCPACPQKMRRLKAELEGTSMDLDACLTCMLLWFDKGELELIKLKTKEYWPQDKINYESYRPAWTRSVPYQQRCVRLLASLTWI